MFAPVQRYTQHYRCQHIYSHGGAQAHDQISHVRLFREHQAWPHDASLKGILMLSGVCKEIVLDLPLYVLVSMFGIAAWRVVVKTHSNPSVILHEP